VPDPAATNLASLLAQARRDRCPACRGPIAAVPRASDRAELTCLDPGCTWAARIEGGRVIPLAAEAVDQDDELYPDRPGSGGPACDTREHRRRPPCRLCRKVSHEGGLCEYHWLNYLHETRHRNPRPHPLDWSLTQMPPVPQSPTAPPQHQEETDPMKAPLQPCLCGCGQQIKPDSRRKDGPLCKDTVWRLRHYRNKGGSLPLDQWLAAGQPSAVKGRLATKPLPPLPLPDTATATAKAPAPVPPSAPVISDLSEVGSPGELVHPAFVAASGLSRPALAAVSLDKPTRAISLLRMGRYVGAYDESGQLIAQIPVN
jgi:hypothetical protein